MPLFPRFTLKLILPAAAVLAAASLLLCACGAFPAGDDLPVQPQTSPRLTNTHAPAPTRTPPDQIRAHSWPIGSLTSFHAAFTFTAEPLDSVSYTQTVRYEVNYAADRTNEYAYIAPKITSLKSFEVYFTDGLRFTHDQNTQACPSVPSFLPPFNTDPAVFTAGLVNPQWLLNDFSGLELEKKGDQLFNGPTVDRYHFSNAATDNPAWSSSRITGTIWLDPGTGGIAAYQASVMSLFDVDGDGQPQTARLTWTYQLTDLNLPIRILPPTECIQPSPVPLTDENWFENFPLPEGAQLATFNSGGITALVPANTIEELAAFYRVALTGHGWTLTADEVTAAEGMITARQDPLALVIHFSQAGEGALNLSIIPQK
ncbi:MAG: hypothetical protein HGA53_02705 [Anaerolineaceae bacterium]|nr:hypothetical protein [Anaerolineaceae bacterium]